MMPGCARLSIVITSYSIHYTKLYEEVETNRSVEVGASVTRSLNEGAVSGWEVQGSFFQNTYDNKFRSISTPGIPLTLYDNVDNAQISGLEAKAGLYFWGKKVLAEVGLSRYYISRITSYNVCYTKLLRSAADH